MRRAFGLSILLLAFAATSADAEVRKAVRSGGAIVGTCVSTPCELQYAIGQAATDDIVELAPSTIAYTDPDGYLVNKRITLRGQAGADRPIVSATAGGFSALRFMTAGANGATAEHLTFVSVSDFAVGGDASGVTLRDVTVDTLGGCVNLDNATVQDVTAKSSSTTETCVQLSSTAGPSVAQRLTVDMPNNSAMVAAALSGTAEDLTVTAKGIGVMVRPATTIRRMRVTTADAPAVITNNPLGSGTPIITDSIVRATAAEAVVADGVLALTNVTAVGTTGLRAASSPVVSSGSISAVNVIARGSTPATDVVADPDPGPCIIGDFCGPGAVALSFSNVRAPAAGAITHGAGMQSADPKFVSATDLHITADSPARNAGTSEGVDSTKDVDGDARVLDAAIDIGADELPPPLVVVGPPAGGTTTPAAPAAPTASVIVNVPPVLSLLKGGKKGTVTFLLSEVASVAFKVERKTAGRRKGARCVAPTPKLKRARACVRFVSAGTTTVQGAAGANTKTIKVKGKALKPGSYRLTVTPTDAFGMPGRPATVTLKVAAAKKKAKTKT